MIVDERMVTFINSLDEGHTEFLEQLEKERVRRGHRQYILSERLRRRCRVCRAAAVS